MVATFHLPRALNGHNGHTSLLLVESYCIDLHSFQPIYDCHHCGSDSRTTVAWASYLLQNSLEAIPRIDVDSMNLDGCRRMSKVQTEPDSDVIEANDSYELIESETCYTLES